MKSLMYLLFLGTLAISSASQAQDSTSGCTDAYKNFGAFRYHRFQSNEGKCFLSATPTNTPDYVYRSYLMTSEGVLMIFLSIDFNEYGVSDGSRVFQFFPRNQTPEFVEETGAMTVKSATAGFELHLGQDEAKIISISGGDFKEDPKIYPGNNGGLEFSNMKFLYLDSGYMNGADPTGESARKSKFVDTLGKTCEVKNNEVFKWDSDGDPKLKFDDVQLKKFLKTRCPALTVNF